MSEKLGANQWKFISGKISHFTVDEKCLQTEAMSNNRSNSCKSSCEINAAKCLIYNCF